ncbi:MAG TPA: hypothetical protein VIZ20_04915 [Streptosporangiaceae bacterium]
MDSEVADGWVFLDSLPSELAGQRRVLAGLLEFSVTAPAVTSLNVGCSLGRGAGDALSDIDAALGIAAERGAAGAAEVLSVEAAVAAELPRLGPVVDVLRHRTGPADKFARRIFAQFADGPQLDVAVVAEAEIRRGDAAPDFLALYQAEDALTEVVRAAGVDQPSALLATSEQVWEWAFMGWCALIDLTKYLRRGSLWEAHARLNEARDHIWALWAAATGAIYPWHGLSQVLDQDPEHLPPGIEATVATLDPAALRAAARASAPILTQVSTAAAERYPTGLPTAMAAYVTEKLGKL